MPLIQAACPGCKAVLQFEPGNSTQVKIDCPTCGKSFLCNVPTQPSSLRNSPTGVQSAPPSLPRTPSAPVASDPWSNQPAASGTTFPSYQPVPQSARQPSPHGNGGSKTVIVGVLATLMALGAFLAVGIAFYLWGPSFSGYMADSHEALISDFQQHGRDLQMDPPRAYRPDLSINQVSETIYERTNKDLRRAIRVGWVPVSMPETTRKNLQLRFSAELSKQSAFISDKVKSQTQEEKDASFHALQSATKEQQEKFNSLKVANEAYGRFLKSCFSESPVPESPVEKQIAQEIELRMKLLRELAKISSTAQADESIAEMTSIQKEFQTCYLASPNIPVVSRVSKGLLEQFQVTLALYLGLIESLEATHQLSDRFDTAINEMELALDKSKINDERPVFRQPSKLQARILARSRRVAEKARLKETVAIREKSAVPQNNTPNNQSTASGSQADSARKGGSNPQANFPQIPNLSPDHPRRPRGFPGQPEMPLRPGMPGRPGFTKVPESQPNATNDGKVPNRVRLLVKDIDRIQFTQCMQRLFARLKVTQSWMSSSNNDSLVEMELTGSLDEVKDAIDFGKVIAVEEKERRLTIQAVAE